MDESRRCTAKSRSTQQRCKQAAIIGGTVCAKHGGRAPQVRAAAKARAIQMAAHAQAERMVARAGVDVDPIEHLLDSLYHAAALVNVWGEMVAAIDAQAEADAEAEERLRGELGYDINRNPKSPDELVVESRDRLLALNNKGEARVHPYVTEHQEALERRAKFAKMCIDANISDRQVKIAERYGTELAKMLRKLMDGLDLSDEQQAKAKAIVPGLLAGMERP